MNARKVLRHLDDALYECVLGETLAGYLDVLDVQCLGSAGEHRAWQRVEAAQRDMAVALRGALVALNAFTGFDEPQKAWLVAECRREERSWDALFDSLARHDELKARTAHDTASDREQRTAEHVRQLTADYCAAYMAVREACGELRLVLCRSGLT
jgi:hypothetical protein